MKFQNQNKGKKGPRGGGGNSNNNMNSNMNMNGHPGGGGGGGPPSSSSLATLEQKHPVSLLGELASKRRWGPPVYELVCEQGPAHAKNFIFKVTRRKQSGHDGTICNSINPFSRFLLSLCLPQQVRMNGIEYECPKSANNKKEAKASVARFALQELGILLPN